MKESSNPDSGPKKWGKKLTSAGKALGKKNSGRADTARHQQSEHGRRSGIRRSYFLAVVSLVLAGVLIFNLYSLQIVNESYYKEVFQSRIRRTVLTHAPRGRILDRNGNVLAETISTYNITMNDLTDDSQADNAVLNDRIRKIIGIVNDNDDEMVTDFNIQLVGGSFYFKEIHTFNNLL